ncbi:hypothetical protein Tco_0789879, partial [Tanacetum coccineum]
LDLQVGDTVIFSRLNPGEKLVVGCRKAAVAADAQLEGKTPAAKGFAVEMETCRRYVLLIYSYTL